MTSIGVAVPQEIAPVKRDKWLLGASWSGCGGTLAPCRFLGRPQGQDLEKGFLILPHHMLWDSAEIFFLL